jgi:hypothetical protein
MSGELFSLLWKERRCARAHYDLAREASGVLLFVHPNTVVEPVRIDEVTPIVEEIGATGDITDDGAPRAWDGDRVPTQVKLVDLVQALVREPFSVPHVQLAVIISAWDLVSEWAGTPASWLATRLPLLDQYLRANPERFASRIFGVSAQGGDLTRDGERLLQEDVPAQRIVVVEDSGQSHDLTGPVRWAMGQEVAR